MKFTKYNNRNRRRTYRPRKHSESYVAERREEMWREISKSVSNGADPNGPEVDAIIKAFNIILN